MSKLQNSTDRSLEDILTDAEAAEDLEALKDAKAELHSMLESGFLKSEKSVAPFSPSLEMTDEFRDRFLPETEGGAEAGFGRKIGNLALDSANALAAAERRVAFRIKTFFGFKGLRIVEEGDSWTQYPVLLEDIVDQLDENNDFAIYSVGAAGDLVADMAQKKQYIRAIEEAKADAMILSGGGNDLFGDLGKVLLNYRDGIAPENLINETAFTPLFEAVMESYRVILADVVSAHPDLMVFGHGYDLPYPEEDGNWIGPALTSKGIPLDIGREIVRAIMNRFNDALQELDSDVRNFVYCDLRGKVGPTRNSWFDELHPRNPGYGRAAAAIEAEIRKRAQQSGAERSFVAETSSGAAKTVVIDPGHGGTTMVGGSSPNNAKGPKGMLEKNVTLDVAKRTRDILKARGVNVLLTREMDVNSALSARAKVAKDAKASVFVSLHFNGFNGSVQGTETFVHNSTPAGSGNGSRALCRAIQAEMVTALGHNDRNQGHADGVKLGAFGVINPSSHAEETAAVLHEVSFMDVADEEIHLSNVSYRRKIATALADGIESFIAGTLGAEFGPITDEEEIGDGFELGLFHPELLEKSAELDTSNGHMIAEGNLDQNFIQAFAAGEARYVSEQIEDFDSHLEGNERSDYSAVIEAAFMGRTTNAESNVGLVQRLFARAETSTFDYSAFETFILGLRLRHFSPGEFLVLGGQNEFGECAGKNTLPPRTMWPNIRNTALMIDEIRERLGLPILITSAYRSQAYNSCIDGAPGSQHLRYNALDWQAQSGEPEDWYRVAVAVRDSDPSRFNGYINAYPTFVHIDTRHS